MLTTRPRTGQLAALRPHRSELDLGSALEYGLDEMYEPGDEHRSGHVSVSEARETFAELVNRAAYGHERVRVVRRGRPVAAIVPIGDLELLERLEDEVDLLAARDALADPENAVPIPWEQVKSELGL
jgi:prevent-host-death family protein